MLPARPAFAQQSTIPKPPAALRDIFKGTPPRTANDLKSMQAHVLKLAKAVRKCTVSVQDGMAHGSGVIINEEGYVLTVAHVVGKPGKEVTVRFNDGRIERGYSLGMHLELDAGLIKLRRDGPCLLYTSPSPRDLSTSRMPSSA